MFGSIIYLTNTNLNMSECIFEETNNLMLLKNSQLIVSCASIINVNVNANDDVTKNLIEIFNSTLEFDLSYFESSTNFESNFQIEERSTLSIVKSKIVKLKNLDQLIKSYTRSSIILD